VRALFPSSGIVSQVVDGDTFTLKNGVKVRLLGVDAPPGTPTRAENYLMEQIFNKKVYLEYDRYQDDKYGRVLAWVWINCETTPTFLPADYMHKSGNESSPGLTANPTGCKKGKLVNEELVKNGFAKVVVYDDRGELKYEQRLQTKK
jgi:endonuclease YncB( thermonuclease family)